MEWAKSGYSTGKYNLARSGVPSIANAFDLPGGPFRPDTWGHNEGGHEGLKAIIAQWYGVQPENVLLAQGASQCDFLIAGAVLADGGAAIVETPVYEPLLCAVEVWADRIVRLPRKKENCYLPDPAELRGLLGNDVRLVALTNLHNPTHALTERDLAAEIVRTAQESGATMMVDEVFLPMIARDHRMHAASVGAISVNSLGKSWGLDTLRVGWAVGPAEIVQRAYRLNNLMGVNQPYMTEDLAWRVLQSERAVDFLIAEAENAARGRALLQEFVENTPQVTLIPPSAGISALVELPRGTDDRRFSQMLLAEKDTVVFPGSYFECPGTIRVSFGGPREETAEGLRRLSEMVKSWH